MPGSPLGMGEGGTHGWGLGTQGHRGFGDRSCWGDRERGGWGHGLHWGHGDRLGTWSWGHWGRLGTLGRGSWWCGEIGDIETGLGNVEFADSGGGEQEWGLGSLGWGFGDMGENTGHCGGWGHVQLGIQGHGLGRLGGPREVGDTGMGFGDMGTGMLVI